MNTGFLDWTDERQLHNIPALDWILVVGQTEMSK